MAAPGDGAAGVVCELHCHVRHEPRRSSAVPVGLAGLEEDAVAGANHLDRPAFALTQADALGHPDRLAERVRMPCGARARCEVDGRGAEPRCFAGRGDRVDVDGAGEPVVRPASRLAGVARDLHMSLSVVVATRDLPRRASRQTPWLYTPAGYIVAGMTTLSFRVPGVSC